MSAGRRVWAGLRLLDRQLVAHDGRIRALEEKNARLENENERISSENADIVVRP